METTDDQDRFARSFSQKRAGLEIDRLFVRWSSFAEAICT